MDWMEKEVKLGMAVGKKRRRRPRVRWTIMDGFKEITHLGLAKLCETMLDIVIKKQNNNRIHLQCNWPHAC